jgi:hypothetical protein
MAQNLAWNPHQTDKARRSDRLQLKPVKHKFKTLAVARINRYNPARPAQKVQKVRCSNRYSIVQVIARNKSHAQWPPCHARAMAVFSLIVMSVQDLNRADLQVRYLSWSFDIKLAFLVLKISRLLFAYSAGSKGSPKFAFLIQVQEQQDRFPMRLAKNHDTTIKLNTKSRISPQLSWFTVQLAVMTKDRGTFRLCALRSTYLLMILYGCLQSVLSPVQKKFNGLYTYNQSGNYYAISERQLEHRTSFV